MSNPRNCAEQTGPDESNPRLPDRLVLTGFMGSGKTTVGRLLAARLGWTFLDLDEQIALRCRLSVPEIFLRFGEARFRDEEHRALAACLARTNLVLALGGGAPEAAANRVLLQRAPRTAVIYLSGPFDTLHARCVAQSVQAEPVLRPVLADAEAARLRFARRAPMYEEIASMTLDTDATPQSIAEQIAARLCF